MNFFITLFVKAQFWIQHGPLKWLYLDENVLIPKKCPFILLHVYYLMQFCMASVKLTSSFALDPTNSVIKKIWCSFIPINIYASFTSFTRSFFNNFNFIYIMYVFNIYSEKYLCARTCRVYWFLYAHLKNRTCYRVLCPSDCP